MRIGMRLLLGYFLIVAVAAWFVLSIFVPEIKPGVRRATEGTLIDAMQTIGKNITDPRLKAILKENSGIGTEATRAGIIANLIERGFITKKGNITIVHQLYPSLVIMDVILVN